MPGAETTLDAALRMDSTIMLVDDPVKRVDNMTMAWGLEARVPFLDHELVELAAACPPELKLAHGGKGVLKEAARGNVPDGVIDRPKGYFPVPAIRHLEGAFLDRVRDAVDATPSQRRAGWSAATGSRPCWPTRTPHGPTSARTRCGRSRCWRCGCRRGGSDLVECSAERAPQTSDVVTEADFVRRRRDRLSPEHDPALFATAYSAPSPPPTDGCWPGSPTGTAAPVPAWPPLPPGRLRRGRTGLAAAHGR